MAIRRKYDEIFDSVGKAVNNLQKTSLDDFIHNVRYKISYYRIHARLNYYSNSKNPRVIHTKFKNQKLTTLRTNPHDPYFVKPGEFLTLAKKEPEDTFFDDLLSSYYDQGNSRKVYTAPMDPSQPETGLVLHSVGPEDWKTSNCYTELSQRQLRNSSYVSMTSRVHATDRNAVSQGLSRDFFDLNDYIGLYSHGPETITGSKLVCSQGRNNLRGTICPVHLVPHLVTEFVQHSSLLQPGLSKQSHVGLKRSQGESNTYQVPAVPRRQFEKKFYSFEAGKETEARPFSTQSVVDSNKVRSRSGSRKTFRYGEKKNPDHQGNRDVLNGRLSQERMDQLRHFSEILAMLDGDKKNQAADLLNPNLQPKTRKIRRKYVKRSHSTGSGLRNSATQPGMDSIGISDVSFSNTIDASYLQGSQIKGKTKEAYAGISLNGIRHQLDAPPLPLRSGSNPRIRNIQSSNSRIVGGANRGSNSSPVALNAIASPVTPSKKSLRFKEIEDMNYERPSSSHVFRTTSLRTHSKNSRCLCSKCDETKVWRVVLSDISLSAARLSTGSDCERTKASGVVTQKFDNDLFAENLKQARARYYAGTKMPMLQSTNDWSE